MTKIVVLVVAFLGALITGCVPHTYQVRQAALVAPPTPPQWSGKGRGIGFQAGNSTVIWKNEPKQAVTSDSGLYVSQTQFDGVFHFGVGAKRQVSFWFPFSYGLSEGSFAAAPGLVSPPDAGVVSAGLGFGFSQELTEDWYLGLSFEAFGNWIPTHLVSRCEDCPGKPISSDVVDTDFVPVIRPTLIIGLNLGDLRVFGGLSLRNHPTNVKIRSEYNVVPPFDAEVSMGPLYAVAGFGVEYDVGENVSVLGQIFQPLPLAEHDLIYGPIAGLSLDVHAL